MQGGIPKPTILRLCLIYRVLDELLQNGVQSVSSTQIADRLSMNSHNVRKDIGYLGDVGNLGAGYDVIVLKKAIAESFGLNRTRNACVVGLGRLGSAVLNFEQFQPKGYKIVAGFDSNINKIETMRTAVSLSPSYMIAEVVRMKKKVLEYDIRIAHLSMFELIRAQMLDFVAKSGCWPVFRMVLIFPLLMQGEEKFKPEKRSDIIARDIDWMKRLKTILDEYIEQRPVNYKKFLTDAAWRKHHGLFMDHEIDDRMKFEREKRNRMKKRGLIK